MKKLRNSDLLIWHAPCMKMLKTFIPDAHGNLPGDWLSLLISPSCSAWKHGFDADHLATIDGPDPLQRPHPAGMARYCGTFSRSAMAPW